MAMARTPSLNASIRPFPRVALGIFSSSATSTSPSNDGSNPGRSSRYSQPPTTKVNASFEGPPTLRSTRGDDPEAGPLADGAGLGVSNGFHPAFRACDPVEPSPIQSREPRRNDGVH